MLLEMLQNTLNVFLVAFFFNDCLATLAAIYRTDKAEYSLYRDAIFLLVLAFCVHTLSRTWLKSMTIAYDVNDVTGGKRTIISVYKVANNKSEIKKAEDSESEIKGTSVEETNTEEKHSEDTQEQEHDALCKPSTPSPTNETSGPDEEE